MTRHVIAILTVVLALGGCSDPAWQTRDISGLMPPLAFTLTDENGRTVTAEDYRGKATLVFFGFTSCPDICPVTLGRLARILDRLPEHQREQVQVLFVSVDPGRDTPQKLKEYTGYFGDDFIGLTGSQAQLRELTKRYRVTYGYGEPDEDGHYSVSHSALVFGFGPDGRARIMIRDDDPPEAVLADLKRLIEAG